MKKNDGVNKKHLEQQKRKSWTTENINQKLKTLLKQTSHPTNEKDQPLNGKSHYTHQYQKEKATQILDKNLANKTLVITITKRLNKQYWSPRHNQRASRNRTLEISQQTTDTNEKEAFQNEITSLKKEIEDLKKKGSTKSQIPTRRQAMTS